MATTALLARPDDHRGLLSMAEAVEATLQAFRDWAADPLVGELRRRTHTPNNVRITLHQGGSVRHGVTGVMTHAELVRIYGEVQRYPRRGRPVMVLYDAQDGALKLILVGEMHPGELPHANSVVAMPTACASIAGTHLLARWDTREVGVFGAGDQARHQLLGLKCVRPSLRKARVFSPTKEKREAFAREMAEVVGIEVTAVEEPRQVVDGADVVLCCTNSNVPVFDGNWLVPGQHVTSIVSSNVGLLKRGHVAQMRREVDDRVLERADVLMTNALAQEELDRTAVFWEAVERKPELQDKLVDMLQVLRGDRPGRTSNRQVTYYKNCATWGIGAAAIGGLIYERLLAEGRGLPLDFDPFEYSDGAPVD
jgi:ornithine cyclodeaminase/alanine dehydrogenase-like protein (mu-crystallin family)